MRMLGVIRLSRKADNSVSPAAQRSTITDYCADEKHPHEIVGWAEDIGVSGEKDPFNRPSLGPWLGPDKAELYDGLIARKMDRFSRRFIDFAHLVDWADRNGKVVISIDDNIDTSTGVGRMMAHMVGLLADWELRTIRERNLAAKEELREKLRYLGGKIPYGYWPTDSQEGGKLLEIDEEAAEVVREMTRRVLDGESVADLKRWLNDSPHLPPQEYMRLRLGRDLKGTGWYSTTILNILKSRTLLGEFTHKGTLVTDDLGIPKRRTDPILTYDEFNRLQARVVHLSKPMQHRNSKGLLAGIAHCAGCGSKMYLHVTRRGDRVYPYYRCAAAKLDKHCEMRAAVPTAELDQAVIDRFLAMVGPDERKVRVWQPAQDNSERLQQIDNAIAAARWEFEKGYYKGTLADYQARMERLNSEKEELEAIPAQRSGWRYVGLGETFQQAWDKADSDEDRRALLVSVNAQVHTTSDVSTMTLELALGSDEHPDIEMDEEGK